MRADSKCCLLMPLSSAVRRGSVNSGSASAMATPPSEHFDWRAGVPTSPASSQPGPPPHSPGPAIAWNWAGPHMQHMNYMPGAPAGGPDWTAAMLPGSPYYPQSGMHVFPMPGYYAPFNGPVPMQASYKPPQAAIPTTQHHDVAPGQRAAEHGHPVLLHHGPAAAISSNSLAPHCYAGFVRDSPWPVYQSPGPGHVVARHPIQQPQAVPPPGPGVGYYQQQVVMYPRFSLGPQQFLHQGMHPWPGASFLSPRPVAATVKEETANQSTKTSNPNLGAQ